ncbi:MAG: hypothetical protein MK179_11470 [Pirellulaceae bacterium]|nr:hypothetical protein [Pirellulaceae bacterium]
MKAFCEVFSDSSLWMGSGTDWVLFGVREPHPGVSEEQYVRQWKDPVVGPELRRVGFDFPAQLAAYFIADRKTLLDLTEQELPVEDNFPHRLSPRGKRTLESQYRELMEPESARERFRTSEHIRQLFPDGIRKKGLEFFDYRYPLHDALTNWNVTPQEKAGWKTLHQILTESSFQVLPLFLLGSTADELPIIETAREEYKDDPNLHRKLGDVAFAARNYATATSHYQTAHDSLPESPMVFLRYMYALSMADQKEQARELVSTLQDTPFIKEINEDRDWKFLNGLFDLHTGG